MERQDPYIPKGLGDFLKILEDDLSFQRHPELDKIEEKLLGEFSRLFYTHETMTGRIYLSVQEIPSEPME